MTIKVKHITHHCWWSFLDMTLSQVWWPNHHCQKCVSLTANIVVSSLNWVADCNVETRSLSVDWILRWCYCCVQWGVVMWVRCNIIVLAATAWLESFCQWGRVVVVVHCSAVERDDSGSQRLTRDLHCPMTSDEATRRQWMNVAHDHWRPLHSPTHKYTSVATWWTEYKILNTKHKFILQ